MTREAATPQREPRRYPNGQPDLDDPAWHEEDGHGGCVICLFYVPHTEDEQVRQNWPCAVVREGAGAPLREALTVLCDWIDALERRAHGEFGVWHEERMVAEARDEARAALTATPAPDIDLATWKPPRPDFSKPLAPGNEAWRREDIQALGRMIDQYGIDPADWPAPAAATEDTE